MSTCHHQVQFYDQREYPAVAIAEFLSPALIGGGASLVIATREHYLAIEDALARARMDVGLALSEGRLVHCDSRRVLSEFMRPEGPDRALFSNTVERLLERVVSSNREIRAYGEMVDLLCGDGRTKAAIEVELLWNELMVDRSIALLCAYAMEHFDDETTVFQEICGIHDRVKPIPDTLDLATDPARLMAELQQRGRALARESKRRRKFEASAQQATSHLTKLHRVTSALLETLTLSDVAEVITTETMRVLEATSSLVAIAEKEGRTLKTLARVGPRTLDLLAAKAFHSERPIYLVERDGSESIVCHPIGTSGRYIGAVCFGFDTKRAFATDERALIDDVSKQLALALERARLHEEARANHAMLEAIVGSAMDAIITADSSQHVVLFNRAAERMLGWTSAEIIGAPLSKFLPIDSLGALERRGLETLSAKRADGSELPVEIATAELELSGGRFLSIILRDITERQRTEQALRDANRRKDEFLAILGHELRNPLAPIMTALQLMKLRGDTSGEKERSVIERQVRHVSRLVDDLLDVSRISTGKIDLKKEQVEVSWLIARSIEMTRPLIEQRGHRLSVEVSRDVLTIEVDRVRMAQAIANLLTNAAKYTDPGGEIAISGTRNGGSVLISVKDDGIGLKPEVMQQIFEPFVQVNRTLERAQGGIGLGLWLVKNLVELHGGQISVESQGLGWGSEFVIELPASIGAEEDAEQRGEPYGSPIAASRVLIVDDNPDAAEMLADLLRAVGHQVAVVNDAPEALHLADSETFDIAILDIGLPIMDGHELARRLREKARAPIRFVAVTGYGTEDDRARSRANGFEAHFVKPFDHAALLSTIESLVGAGHTS